MMKEDFLHYIWKFKKFDFNRATTVEGLPVTLINTGIANMNAGPDFFNARLIIGEQLWAGNVEIHIKSSDWYSHSHELDPAYDSVILHVVWEDDVSVFRKNNTPIPTLELKQLVQENVMQSYRELLLAPADNWINCEQDFQLFEEFSLHNWLERLYLERLERKSGVILNLLEISENNWEAVLFKMLAKNFGLKINGGAFLGMANSFDFRIVQKCRESLFRLEALYFGQAGLLDNPSEEKYYLRLREEYDYLKTKYALENNYNERPKYFRLRPDNFPTIRLAQLAALYSSVSHLFSRIMAAKSAKELQEIFDVEVSAFWKTHYTFEKSHTARGKRLSAAFVDLLIINTIIPLKFCFDKQRGKEDPEGLFDLLREVKSEKNSIISKFNSIRPKTAVTALHSQALLHLKSEYCDKNACLRCNFGAQLLSGKI